jgi:hypothetical protein
MNCILTSDEVLAEVLCLDPADMAGGSFTTAHAAKGFLEDFIILTAPYLGYRVEQINETPPPHWLETFGITDDQITRFIQDRELGNLSTRLKATIEKELAYGTQEVNRYDGRFINVLVYRYLYHMDACLSSGQYNNRTQLKLDEISERYVAGLTRIFVMLNDQLCEEVSRIIFHGIILGRWMRSRMERLCSLRLVLCSSLC